MCYKKIRLKNPVKEDHKTGFDKAYIKAPCCKCPSCRKVKSNDWLVRSYFEFMGNEGKAFFVTLDYDDYHLPKFKGVQCWETLHMKLFFKRLRNAIGSFRYLYATDYGGFLKRSHYHAMIVPKDLFLSKAVFMKAVSEAWSYGNHQDVQLLDSVDGNSLAAVEYVCGYVNKDIAFNPSNDIYKDMPISNRPRVQASKGYGLRALEEGIITPEMILSGQKVSLAIGRNGRVVQLPIPRYYEMKLCYDYSWNSKEKKAELKKNQLGVELAENRHNRCYVYQFNDFFASRFSDVSQFNFTGRDWKSLVMDCVENHDDFLQFLYYRPFIDSYGFVFNEKYNRALTELEPIHDSLTDEWYVSPQWHFYESCMRIYENFKASIDSIKCERETAELVESAKARARSDLYRHPGKYYYLKRKGYDFNQLKPN